MEWGYKFSDLQKQIIVLEEKINSLAEAYAEAEDFTQRFLDCCKKHKITLVSIGRRTALIGSSVHYPFGCADSVFAEGRDKRGFPTIWSVVEEFGISGGAGNGGQHQITHSAKLVDGVYEFKGNQWRKIE